MAKNDDGHYELVLGNRQLVSGFFVLIILFAIFLTLGYVLGRNSVVKEERTLAQSGTSGEMEIRHDEPPAPPRRPNTERPSPSESAAGQPEATVAAAAAPERAVTEPKPVAVAEKPSAAQAILNSKVNLITPRRGDVFVQVAAIGRVEAELMAEQLQTRGYRTFISEVPGRDLFRVLVGPFETTARLNETRKKLEDEGINSIVQRY